MDINWQLANAQKQLAELRKLNGVDARLSTDTPRQPRPSPGILENIGANDQIPQEATQEARPTATVRIFSGLTTVFLDHDNRLDDKPIAPVARLWLALRSLANDRGGAVVYRTARDLFARSGSPHRMFGERQFKGLLARGEGVFWTRGKDARGELRIWLHGVVKVADSLGVDRLQGKPVDVPFHKITADNWKANLYTAWVAGRGADAHPMSRDVKARLTGVSKYRQRNYEADAGIQVKRNYCINSKYSDYNLERARQIDGRVPFRLVDVKGRYGRAGQDYVAWHLPNSDRAPRWCVAIDNRRTRAINKSLADPCISQGEGNGGDQIARVFFDNGKAASLAASKHVDNQAYWPAPSFKAGMYYMAGRDGR